MPIAPNDWVPLIVSTSFAAGLNVYATVATLGILGRVGVVPLPPGLHAVTAWYVIAIAIVLFVIEFFADKIPAFDLVWNALHTFIRVPVAALLAYRAAAALPPWEQAIAAVAGGTIAFAAHGAKTSVRAAVTPSPEPISNAALSMGEDVGAIGLTWFATQHPYWAAGVTLVLLIIIVFLIRWMVRALRNLFRGAKRVLRIGTDNVELPTA